MMTVGRRLLVLAVLTFWQGGFTFYATVVVPVGREVLGAHGAQAVITRQVTNSLNLAGALALVPLAWDTLAALGVSKRRVALRWGCWLVMALTLALLAGLHLHLDTLMDQDTASADRPAFYAAHRWYLLVSTVQWACAVTYMVLAVLDWRAEDRAGV
jgi:hypothetical protein